ncbi:MAG: hypothetical protein QGG53_07010 [Planctomycetota bacterium]|jgi:ureidoglycolate hydrolase|nr:hypothetical protein [Planctomycetota bacterium]
MKVIKVKIEPLSPEAFEPFGQVISSFNEIGPEVRVGGLQEREYTVTAETSEPPPEKPSLSEGLARAHFAFHTDAGQSFYPSRHCPTVFFVGPVKEVLGPDDIRAFFSDGSLGICMHPEIWHTMPICLEGTEVYQTARGDQDYQTYSVEVDFDAERGLTLEPDVESSVRTD